MFLFDWETAQNVDRYTQEQWRKYRHAYFKVGEFDPKVFYLTLIRGYNRDDGSNYDWDETI
jgi:hypothetical protein